MVEINESERTKEKRIKRKEDNLRDLQDKGTTEDEMAGWHHRLDGLEFE